MLRKASHYDYYHGEQFGAKGPSNGYWLHLEHCTYMLLQTLKCHADVDLFYLPLGRGPRPSLPGL